MTLPTGITSTPIAEYGDGFKVQTQFTIYTFMTVAAADRFASRASKPGAKRTPASAVHQRAYRLGSLPVCLARIAVKSGLQVQRTAPPDRNRPSPALRIVEKQAA